MENSNTLFGHLAGKFAAHPENIATEALLYILGNSKVGSTVFSRILQDIDSTFSEVNHFDSQVTSSGDTIPDLIGYGTRGEKLIIVENKFWAELTPNQPIGYLPLLDQKKTSSLVFVCPQKRLNVLNSEIERIVVDSGKYKNYQNISNSDQLISNRVNENQYLIVTSWRRILSSLETLLDPINERSLVEDVKQLNGLCEQMDSEGFIPLRSHESQSSEIPRRIVNYIELIWDIVNELIKNDVASTEGLRRTYDSRRIGTYINIRKKGEFGAGLFLNFENWRIYGFSPLWLSFYYDSKYGKGNEAGELLKKSNIDFFDIKIFGDNHFGIPINLSTNSERQKVIYDAYKQIESIAHVLHPNFPGQADSKPTKRGFSDETKSEDEIEIENSTRMCKLHDREPVPCYLCNLHGEPVKEDTPKRCRYHNNLLPCKRCEIHGSSDGRDPTFLGEWRSNPKKKI